MLAGSGARYPQHQLAKLNESGHAEEEASKYLVTGSGAIYTY